RELIYHSVTGVKEGGRTVELDGVELVNFGSCSYLGLEHHEALKAGAIAAIEKFGMQFSSSRTFASLSLYRELESKLEQVFGQPVIVNVNTTLAHQTVLPVIVGDKDALILDLQVHTSVQTAAQLLKADGVRVDVIRHGSMAALERKLKAFKGKYRKVWYLADGVYSMFGDTAPIADLQRLLDEYPNFHAYIDDAHGFGWKGERGEGWVRSQWHNHPRMVTAVSFNKAFGCIGGCVVFPDEAMRDLVKKCGGPLIFSGPLPAPVLGALVAAADLYLSGALRERQAWLAELVDFTNKTALELGVPQYAPAETPLFFIPMGLPRLTFKLAARLKEEGLYAHVGSFPATPMKQSGLRFMLNANHSKADVRRLLERIRHHYPIIVEEEGTTCAEIAGHFDLPPFEVERLAPMSDTRRRTSTLVVERHRTIDALDTQEWDALFAGAGNLSASALRDMESVFSAPGVPEEHCEFYYRTIRDERGRPVLATMFTSSLMKDDMFSPASVSAEIEAIRAREPHFLTSRTIGLGAPITKGRHLYLDRAHPDWKEAVRLLVREMEEVMQEQGANQLMLRELIGEEDCELSQHLYDLGLSPVRLPDVSRIASLGFATREEYMKSLGASRRNDLRREILKHEDRFEVVTEPLRTLREIRVAHRLYQAVAERSFELNLFRLPERYFEAVAQNPDHDILRLYLKGDRDRDPEADPVAIMISHVHPKEYTALIVGLDYRFVESHNSYKQILFQTVMRANELGCASLDLAFTATDVKKKVGARPEPARAYVQLLDHFNMSVIHSMTRKAA
ncbi:MAG: aminotransferase class I/II-fold pyridoxal phosphate-dependent enzyme, partial [Polyangiaceae bacterium]